MKRLLILLFLSIISTNCSINSNDNYTQPIVTVYWNLVNVNGGIDGVNIDYAPGEIVWSFDEINAILTVTNSNSNTSSEDGLDSGTYPYSVIDDSHNLFLKIDNTEYGSFTVSGSQLVIDQNLTTSGSGADGYVYTFQKTTVVE